MAQPKFPPRGCLFVRLSSLLLVSCLLAACSGPNSGSTDNPAGGGQPSAPNILAPADKATEDQARTAVSALIRGQMAYFVEQGDFAKDIGDLGVGINPETDTYRYTIDYIDGGEVHVVGLAQQPDLHSYIASAFVVDTGAGETVMTITCITDDPSQEPPDLPPIPKDGGALSCGPGSSRVD